MPKLIRTFKTMFKKHKIKKEVVTKKDLNIAKLTIIDIIILIEYLIINKIL